MTTTTTTDERAKLREQQVRQAEELLFKEAPSVSFAKELFHGRFAADLIIPYPSLKPAEQAQVDESLRELQAFCDEHLDPEKIDREADIPRDVIDGLGRLGVLGMTAPVPVGGRGYSQLAYCKLLE